MAYQIDLGDNVTCYGLLDSGKLFVNKDISSYLDFTDISDINNINVTEKYQNSGFSKTDPIIPIFSQVSAIRHDGFADCNLQHAKFPGLQIVEDYALKANVGIKNIELADIKQIGSESFADCKLSTVYIGKNIERIAQNAFVDNDPLAETTIESFVIDKVSSDIQDIEECYPFGIANPEVIKFNERSEQPIPPEPEHGELTVATGVTKGALENEWQMYWNSEISNVVDFTDLDVIEHDVAISRTSGIENPIARFKDGVEFGYNAFGTYIVGSGTKFNHFVMPGNVQKIGINAFATCSGFNVIDLPEIRTIGAVAFVYTDLAGITIGDKIEEIGSSAFSSCSRLSSVHFVGKHLYDVKFMANYPFGADPNKITAELADDRSFVLTVDVLSINKAQLIELAKASKLCCDEILSIEIQPKCRTIAAGTFADCTALQKVHFVRRTQEQVSQYENYPWNLTDDQLEFDAPPTEKQLILDSAIEMKYLRDGDSRILEVPGRVYKYLDLTDQEEIGDCRTLKQQLQEQGLSESDQYEVYLSKKCIMLNAGNYGQIFFNNGLTKIDIPDSVELVYMADDNEVPYKTTAEWMMGPFLKCYNLSSFSVESSNKHYASDGKSLLIDKYRNAVLRGFLTDTVPGNIEEIDDYAFAGQYNLKKFTIPSSVKHIGFKAFCNINENEPISDNEHHTSTNEQLSLYFEGRSMDDVIQMENYPWNVNPSHIYVDGNPEITWPIITDRNIYSIPNSEVVILSSNVNDGAQFLKVNAAANLDKLKTLVVVNRGTSTMTFEENSVYGCNNLKAIRISSNKYTRFNANAVHDCASIEEVWCMIMTGPTETRWTGLNANNFFRNCPKLRRVHSRFIGTSANYCISLPNFNLARYADKVASEDQILLQWRQGLTDELGHLRYVVPAATELRDSGTHEQLEADSAGFPIETVDLSAAKGRKELSSVQLDYATSIDAYAFADCSALTNVSLKSVNHIDPMAFANAAILSVEEPIVYLDNKRTLLKALSDEVDELSEPDVKFIASKAFDGIQQLHKADFAGATILDNAAFANCYSLQELSIPNATTVRADAFANTALTSLELTAANRIDGYAFRDSNIRQLNVSSLTALADNQFYGCRISEISLPKISSIASYTSGKNAFAGLTVDIDMPNLTSLQEGNVFDDAVVGEFNISQLKALGGSNFNRTRCERLELPELTSASDRAFANSQIRDIHIPKLSAFSRYCFTNCSRLVSVDFNQITAIGEYALSGCTNLNLIDLHIPLLTSVNKYIFADSGIKSLDIPMVSTLTNGCMADCRQLTNLNVPALTGIDNYALSGCTALRTLNLPNVTRIGQYGIADCTSLNQFHAPELTSIQSYTFASCDSLTQLDTPKLKTIYADAFANSHITSFIVPDTVTSLDRNAFRNCSSLRQIAVEDDNPTYSNEIAGVEYNNAIFKRTELWIAIASLNDIPAGVTSFDASQMTAFYNLTSITIPASYTGNLYHLSGMPNLQHIVVDEGNRTYTSLNGSDCVVNKSSGKLLAGCKNTKFVPGIKSISEYAFYGRELDELDASLTAGANLTAIDDKAFSGCSRIGNIKLEHNVAFSTNAFKECNYIGRIDCAYETVPDGMLSGLSCIRNVNLPNAIDIGTQAFANCENLRNVSALMAYTLGEYAFANCIDLENIHLDGITAAGHRVFENCSSLISVDLSEITVGQNLNEAMFLNCYNLRNVMLSPTVDKIPYQFFQNCYSLTAIGQPGVKFDEVLTVDYSAFQNCNSLAFDNISLNKIKYIGSYAFENCKLTKLSTANLDYVGNAAFANCTQLTSIVIDASDTSLTAFDNEAFCSCENLVDFRLSARIGAPFNIGYRCFDHDRSLTSLDFSNTTLTGVYNAFNYCTNLRNVKFPNTLDYLQYDAFNQITDYWDEQKQETIYSWQTTCPRLTNVYFAGKSMDDVMAIADGGSDSYPSPKWGIDKNIIGLDYIYTSILNLKKPNRKLITASNDLVYSDLPILDCTYGKPGEHEYRVVLNDQWFKDDNSGVDPNGATYTLGNTTNPNPTAYDGTYVSFSNKGQPNSSASMRIYFKGYRVFTIFIRSYAESSYDYVIAGKLDIPMQHWTSTAGQANTQNNQQGSPNIGSYTRVDYRITDTKEHFIDVNYVKDGSVDTAEDRAYVLILK